MSEKDRRVLSQSELAAEAGEPAQITYCSPEVLDLAPMIYRQRLVLEGTCLAPIEADDIRAYLGALSGVCKMRILTPPIAHRSELYGWAGWIHWETSGVHFYAWETPTLFFSVDIYTCKRFDVEQAYRFTKRFFKAPELVAMAF